MNAVVLESKENNEEQSNSNPGFSGILAQAVSCAALILCWCVAIGIIYRIWLQHGNFSVRHPGGYNVPRGVFLVLIPVLIVQVIAIFMMRKRKRAIRHDMDILAYSWVGFLIAVIFDGWIFWPLLDSYDAYLR